MFKRKFLAGTNENVTTGLCRGTRYVLNGLLLVDGCEWASISGWERVPSGILKPEAQWFIFMTNSKSNVNMTKSRVGKFVPQNDK